MIPGILAGGAKRNLGGQVTLSTKGTTSTIVPAGVTSISVVIVGKPGTPTVNPFPANTAQGGGGGGLAYLNNITVSPGSTLNLVVIGNQTVLRVGASSTYLIAANNGVLTVGGAATTGYPGAVSFRGGNAGALPPSPPRYTYSGGGGAGGYAGPGADAATPVGGPTTGGVDALVTTPGNPGSGGSGGSGAGAGNARDTTAVTTGAFGGSVQLFGIGPDGSAGTDSNGRNGGVGSAIGPVGSPIFGGGAPGHTAAYNDYPGGCRIIWGPGRSFPNNALDV